MEKTERFFKNHADTIAIMGVNLAIAGIYLTLLISNMNRIDSANARSDGIMLDFKNESKELREEFYKESKEFHCRLSLLENKDKK